jgi:hypothetical protein
LHAESNTFAKAIERSLECHAALKNVLRALIRPVKEIVQDDSVHVEMFEQPE